MRQRFRQSLRQLRGLMTARAMVRDPATRQQLSAIIGAMVRQAPSASNERRVYILTGMSLAGKTTLRETHPALSGLYSVETTAIHLALNAGIPSLQDDGSINGPAYWPRQALTRWIRPLIYDALFGRGISFVVDSCNLERRTRVNISFAAHRAGYETTIIWVQPHAIAHYERLRNADDERSREGQPRTYYDLVRHIQAPRFEPPSANEAHRILTHFGDAPWSTVHI